MKFEEHCGEHYPEDEADYVRMGLF